MGFSIRTTIYRNVISMTQHTIKQVGSEVVCLDDDESISKIGLKTLLMVGLLYSPMVISILYLFFTPNGINVDSLDTILWVGVFGIIATLFYVFFYEFVLEYEPAYRVYIEGHYDTSITILKTNDKTDQEEICKAANRLVPIAQGFVDHRNKIERIVEKCR